MHRSGRRGEDFVPCHKKITRRWRQPRTRPPGPQDKANPCPSNHEFHEIGRRTLFGVPAATCDRATPFNARLISGDDVGNSIRKLMRWKCSTADSSLAIVPASLPSDANHATNSSNSCILSVSETAASNTQPPLSTPEKRPKTGNLTYKLGETTTQLTDG